MVVTISLHLSLCLALFAAPPIFRIGRNKKKQNKWRNLHKLWRQIQRAMERQQQQQLKNFISNSNVKAQDQKLKQNISAVGTGNRVRWRGVSHGIKFHNLILTFNEFKSNLNHVSKTISFIWILNLFKWMNLKSFNWRTRFHVTSEMNFISKFFSSCRHFAILLLSLSYSTPTHALHAVSVSLYSDLLTGPGGRVLWNDQKMKYAPNGFN